MVNFKLLATNIEHSKAFLHDLEQDGKTMNIAHLQSLERVLHDAAAVLRKVLNAARPINRLAPELLIAIIQGTLDPVEGIQHLILWPSTQIRYIRGLKMLSHVCHRWREVCLATPTLWANILDIPTAARVPSGGYTPPWRPKGLAFGELAMSDPRLVWRKAYLQRAGTTPLRICIGGSAPSSFMSGLFRSDGARIQELHFLPEIERSANCGRGSQGGVVVFDDLGEMAYTAQDIAQYTDFAAPALEHLTIYSTSSTQGERSPILFRNNLPKLKTLSLNSSAWLPGNKFENLTQLAISAPHMLSYTTRQSVYARLRRTTSSARVGWNCADLLELLGRCPRLQDLVLVGIADLDDLRTNNTTHTLPHLRRLSIGRVSPALLHWLLHHIERPSSNVAVSVFGIKWAEAELLSLLPMLADCPSPTILQIRGHVQMIMSPHTPVPDHTVVLSIADKTSGVRLRTDAEGSMPLSLQHISRPSQQMSPSSQHMQLPSQRNSPPFLHMSRHEQSPPSLQSMSPPRQSMSTPLKHMSPPSQHLPPPAHHRALRHDPRHAKPLHEDLMGFSVWRAWTLSTVQELHLADLDDIRPRVDVKALLLALPSLKTIVVVGSGDTLRAVLHALTLPVRMKTHTMLPCPKLTSLHVCTGALDGLLVDVVARRAQAGKRLRKVVVEVGASQGRGRETWMHDGSSEQLRQFADVVQVQPWNGSAPKVKWPAVCSGIAHKYWPRW